MTTLNPQMPSFFSVEKHLNPKKKTLNQRKEVVFSEVSLICPCVIAVPNAITFAM